MVRSKKFINLGIAKRAKALRKAYLLYAYQVFKFMYGKCNAMNYISTKDTDLLIRLLRKEGAYIGSDVSILSPLIFHEARDFSKLSIGDGVHIGRMCLFDLSDEIRIGNRVTISMGTMIITHIDVGASKLKAIYPRVTSGVSIQDDAYLACQSTLLSGVAIGRGSFVAAKALVNADVPDYTMVAGIPAKLIKDLHLPSVTETIASEVLAHNKLRRSQL